MNPEHQKSILAFAVGFTADARNNCEADAINLITLSSIGAHRK